MSCNSRLSHWLRIAAFALPVVIAASILLQAAIIGAKPWYFVPWSACLVLSVYRGRFYFLRSQGREASFFRIGTGPSDPPEHQELADRVALFVGVVLVVATALLPAAEPP